MTNERHPSARLLLREAATADHNVALHPQVEIIDLEQAGSGTGTFRLQGSTVGSIKLTGVTQA